MAKVRFTNPRPKPQPPSVVEAAFRNQLREGMYYQILPHQMQRTLGKHVKYAIDTIENGKITDTKYRTGGFVKAANPTYIVLFNPYLNATWSVQLQRPPNERIRIYSKI
jgi:hypothetical protein